MARKAVGTADLKLVENKPAETVTQRAKPTDDELGEMLIHEWNGDFAHMYGAWHKYSSGVWKLERRAELHFWQVLIRNKKRGISPSAGKAASVEKYCQLRLMVDDDQMSSSGADYVNLENGLYNLTTGEIEDHRRDLYMTAQLPFAYDGFDECPTWITFLESVLVDENHLPDQELIDLVQEAFYYSLTADTSYRVSFWLVGASGTGKSTLVNTLVMLAGDSHSAIDLDTLQQNAYQLAEVAGKRVITFSEPDSRQPLADGVYKKLVSKDPITARSPYGKPFTFVPIGKIWGSMNDTPRVIDRSDAVFGRVLIVPMNRIITEDKKDYRLEEKLKAELAGIFNWTLAGGDRLRKRGAFTRAAQSDAARAQYKRENDNELAFLTERCSLSPDLRLTTDELFAAYAQWCKESGIQGKGKPSVGKDWKRLGLVQERGGGGAVRYWRGVGLRGVLLSEK